VGDGEAASGDEGGGDGEGDAKVADATLGDGEAFRPTVEPEQETISSAVPNASARAMEG
jgi:hypothetical protein